MKLACYDIDVPMQETCIHLPWPSMDSSDNWWRVWLSPSWLWQRVVFFGIFPEQMSDGTGNLFHLSRYIEEVHLVVFVPDLVGDTTRPRLDLVQLKLFLIVSRLTDIQLFVR